MEKANQIYLTNEQILGELQQHHQQLGLNQFTPDGLLNRGEYIKHSDTCFARQSSGSEGKLWEQCNRRILFVTKDQNTGGDEAWDVRTETGRNRQDSDAIRYRFYRMLMYITHGLTHTTPTYRQDYTFSKQEAIETYDTYPLARVNVKKEAGRQSVTNAELKHYMKQDGDFIARQINNLNAHIIVCCGYSESVEDTGNLALNFLNHHGYHFDQFSNDGWVYVDRSRKCIAINTWHLSYCRVGEEAVYYGIINDYFAFLQANPEFFQP